MRFLPIEMRARHSRLQSGRASAKVKQPHAVDLMLLTQPGTYCAGSKKSVTHGRKPFLKACFKQKDHSESLALFVHIHSEEKCCAS